MKRKGNLNREERKTLVKLLAFYSLEKSIIKSYKLRKLGRIKRLIKKKWKKLLPLIIEEHLVTEESTDPKERKRVSDLLLLYSRLYTDSIDPSR